MRTKRAMLSLMANLSLQVALGISGFILPALFISEYGSTVNGLIGSIKQFMAYLALVEAGIGFASIAALYSPLLEGDARAINGVISATSKFYRRAGLILAVLVVLMAWIYPAMVRDQVGQWLSTLMVLIIGASSVAEFFFVGKYRILLTADQRSHVVFNVQALATVITTAISAVLILKSVDVLLIQAVTTVVFASRTVILRHYVRRIYARVNFKADPDFAAIDKRWFVLVHQVAGVVVFNSPVVLITIFLDLRDVSVYLVYAMVFTAISGILTAFSGGVMAGLGELVASSDKQGLARAYDDFEFVYFAVLGWAFTCTAILVVPFIRVYSASFADGDYTRPDVAALLVVIGVANGARVPASTLVSAAGHFRETLPQAILESGINLVASLVFVQFWGLPGVLLGSVCSYAYRTLDLLWYTSRRLLGRSVTVSLRRVLVNLALGGLTALPFVNWWHVPAANLKEWASFAGATAACVLVIFVTGNAVFDFTRFKRSLGRVANLRKGGR